MRVEARAAVAALVSGAMCGVGQCAILFSIHKSNPLLTIIQWLGLPILSLVDRYFADPGNVLILTSVLLGGALWFTLVFMLLPRQNELTLRGRVGQ